jgi:tetratricopeptide (TPR) repeat protein
MQCLADRTVLDYASGRLDAVESSRVDAHLDGCCACRDLVAAAAADTRPAAPVAAGRAQALVVEEAAALLPPRYRVEGVLGRGGMGRVVRARDTTLERDVAVKLVEPRLLAVPEAHARFSREARAVASLDHPHVVRIYDADPDAAYQVMEVVDGESLADTADRGPLPAREVRALAAQLLDALGAVHAAGIVHRDVKPSNVIRRADGSAVLVDFGIARFADVTMSRAGSGPGTPAYMAPEQLRGDAVDGRTDLYGLGATLYQLLVGERFDPVQSRRRAGLGRLHRRCNDRGLVRLVEGCLEPEPSRRFSDAAAARRALERPRPRLGMLLAIAAVAVVFVVALALPEHPPPPAAARSALGGVAVGHDLYARAFFLAQHGDHQRARELTAACLRMHPDDAAAQVLNVLVVWWTHTGPEELVPVIDRALAAPLDPAQRAVVRAVELVNRAHFGEAAMFLEAAERAEPQRAEVSYMLGEARWHGGEHAEGVATLMRAFAADHRWLLALHHVVEHRLALGDHEPLRALAAELEATDPEAAAEIVARVLMAERRIADATALLERSVAAHPGADNLRILLGEALVLAGDFVAARGALTEVFARSPIDARGSGALSHLAELDLYANDLAAFRKVAPSATPIRALAEMLWSGETTAELGRPPFFDGFSMPPLPLIAAAWFLQSLRHGRDVTAEIAAYPEVDVRHYALGVAAEQRGDARGAADEYAAGLATDQRGELRMLLAHHLARVRWQSRDAAGAAAACDEVRHPRVYHPYRAVLLPDCLRWQAH